MSVVYGERFQGFERVESVLDTHTFLEYVDYDWPRFSGGKKAEHESADCHEYGEYEVAEYYGGQGYGPGYNPNNPEPVRALFAMDVFQGLPRKSFHRE